MYGTGTGKGEQEQEQEQDTGVDGVLCDILCLITTIPLWQVALRLQLPTESVPKRDQAKDGQDTEQDRHRLLQADGAGDRRSTEDSGCQKAQLNSVGLAILHLVAAKDVQKTNSAAGRNGRDRASPEEANGATGGRQSTEDV